MNASLWSASAEWAGVIITVLTLGWGASFALLRTQFVTRHAHAASHNVLGGRIDALEEGMQLKVDRNELREMNDRLTGFERQISVLNTGVAETNSLVRANVETSKSLERQLNMLIENELRGEKR